jgi:hypothetical protein
MGESPDSHGRLPGEPPPSAGPRNISQAYRQPTASTQATPRPPEGYPKASDILPPWKRREPHSPSPCPLPEGEGAPKVCAPLSL